MLGAKYLQTLAALVTSLLFLHQANAAICSAVFPDVASSSSRAGGISFDAFAQLIGTDEFIDIPIARDDATRSCNTDACQYSGNTSQALTLPNFAYTNSSQDYFVPMNSNDSVAQGNRDQIFVYQNSTLHMTNNNIESRIDEMHIDDNSTLILDGGVYWFNYLDMDSNAKIVVSNGEQAIIYINTSNFEQNLRFNWDGLPNQLVVVTYTNFSPAINTFFKGYLYSNADVIWDNFGELVGGVNATNISIGESGDFYFDASGISTAEFNGTCVLDANVPSPILYYSMDMCAASSAINDDISANDGNASGGTGVGYTSPYCQAASFDGADSLIDIPDGPIFDLPNGSISFWVYTSDLRHSGSPSAGRMAIFSKDARGLWASGNLTLWIDDNGSVRVRHQNSSQEQYLNTTNLIQENRWHHIVYSWGAQGMHIFVDGTLSQSFSAFTSGIASGSIPMALGASSWQYEPVSSSSRTSQLRDFFKGFIDEFTLFNVQLNEAQVSSINTMSSQACTDCTNDPVLISHWSSDVCSFSNDALIDVISGHNGVIRQGVSLNHASRFCQGLRFTGSSSYATIAHHDDMKVPNGAISLWFKLDDLSHSERSHAGGNGLLSKDTINFADGGHLTINVTAAGEINVRHQSQSASTTFTSAEVVQEKQWHHLVYSFGALGTQIYLDGQLVFADSSHTNGLQNNADDWVIGATSRRRSRGNFSANQYNDFMLGDIDEIKLYENQPSGQDVVDWYNESAETCVTCNSLLAHYSFDEVESSAIQVSDISGNNREGELDSLLDVVLPTDNVYCKGFQADDNTTSAEQVYFDTKVDANELGDQGAISFWFRYPNNWNDGQSVMLFDASNPSASGGAKYLFLAKRNSGALRFGIEDIDDIGFDIDTTAFTYPANEWVHIGVQWNMDARQYRVFVNGAEAIEASYSSGRGIADLTSIVFGDNKSTYIVNEMSDNAAGGIFDDIRLYSQAVDEAQFKADYDDATPCDAVNHYRIEHPETATTCTDPSIVIKACANDTCSELVDDNVTLQMTPSDAWHNSIVSFSGSTTISLQHRTAGNVLLGSDRQSPIAPIRCSSDCEITYQDVGLEFFNRSTGGTDFSAAAFVAETALTQVGVRAIGGSGGSCEALVDGDQTLDLTYQCIATPDASYTPSTCNVPFAGISLSSGSSHSGTITLRFDENGEADFGDFSFADVGQLQLSISGEVNGAVVSGANTTLKLIPDTLQITGDNTSVMPAGTAFNLRIEALGANTSVLPGYQNAAFGAAVVRQLPIGSSAVDAAFYLDDDNNLQSAIASAYTNLPAIRFSNGVYTSSEAFMEESGQYELSVRDENYLGSTIGSNTLQLGRFTPAYFDVQANQPEFTDSCSAAFTYVGQTFAYSFATQPALTVTAYNTRGQITQNYANTEWRLNPTQSTINSAFFYSSDAVYSGDLIVENIGQGPRQSNINVYDGIGTFEIDNTTFRYEKVASPTGNDASPFDAIVNLNISANFFTDSDGICYQTSYPSVCSALDIQDITGTQMRYGRMLAENTFGPENTNLHVPLKAEYLDGGQWRVNDLDSCTSVDLAMSRLDIRLSHDTESSNNLASRIDGLTSTGNLTFGLSDASDLQIAPVLASGEAVAGSFFLHLVPQNSLEHWSEHLNIDWDQDGDIDDEDTPTAAVSFGLFRGNDKTIHWREVF